MNWTPCDYYRVTNGQVECVRAGAIGTMQTAVLVALLLIVLGLLVWQLRRARQEREFEQEVAKARYNRFLELLRDVRMRLMN